MKDFPYKRKLRTALLFSIALGALLTLIHLLFSSDKSTEYHASVQDNPCGEPEQVLALEGVWSNPIRKRPWKRGEYCAFTPERVTEKGGRRAVNALVYVRFNRSSSEVQLWGKDDAGEVHVPSLPIGPDTIEFMSADGVGSVPIRVRLCKGSHPC